MGEVSLHISFFVMTWRFCMEETSVFHILLAIATTIAFLYMILTLIEVKNLKAIKNEVIIL